MYLNTPSSGFSQRTTASQAPSTPMQAPRMGARGLPPSPHTPNTSMAPLPAGTFAPYQHYGLMTPPDSPEKLAAAGRRSDFHPLLDCTMGPLFFDIRHGVHLSGQAPYEAAINHRVNRIILNVGPGIISIEICANNGIFTVGDLIGQLVAALRMPINSVEIANAQRCGVTAPGQQYMPGVSRASVFAVRHTFIGLQLASLGNGVACANCLLR
ncbi:hypothetical protein L226DRAFT_526573 [Lentinus tigrinus ALCF2SS1-7]|uniref:Uncharacterized protein n=1 Tax=Lentinus tigrinus ALCF2SS1-6 TaxID=1328759 RepID=A0A5C2S924_9APHY|nr:hypothetical protein L227DRAFT_502074 [Lentinus tigrinus ALCF2SS1-6]RPD69573.1 hypothetical protein L226DRAFT_526573 [Lentinus tigrinus ALCF2SS1-7]